MIVRVTVNDNDFSGVLEAFMEQFYSNVVYFGIPQYLSEDEKNKLYKKSKELNHLLNPNYDVEWTDENKQKVIDGVKEAFKYYVQNESDEDREYLIENFEVEIMESLKDEWQNGENFYWFQHGDAVVNL